MALFPAFLQVIIFSNYLPLKCCFEAIAIFSSRSSIGLSCPSRSLSGSHSLCKAFSSNRSKIGYIVCGNSMETGKMFSKYLQPRLPRSYNFCWCQLSSFHRQVLVSLNTDSICRTAYRGFIENCLTKINKCWKINNPGLITFVSSLGDAVLIHFLQFLLWLVASW